MDGEIAHIHIPKTAGTSMEQALSLEPRHHTRAMWIRDVGEEQYRQMFSFAFVRNPYARAWSHWNMVESVPREGHPITFTDWCRRVYQEQDPTYCYLPHLHQPQVVWIAGGVTFIGRFESLQDHWRGLLALLDLPHHDLPHWRERAANKGINWRTQYTGEAFDLVSSWYKRDLDRWGYEFDQDAGR